MRKPTLNQLAVLIFAVCPLTMLRLFPENEAVTRIIILTLLLPAAAIVFIWYGLDPRSVIIKPYAKAARSKHKKTIESFFRIFIAAVGVVYLIWLAIPCEVDIYNIINKKDLPQRISGKIVSNGTAFGLWFFYQFLEIETKNSKNQSVFLFYSVDPRLRLQQSYTFTVLPKSKLVIQVEEAQNQPEQHVD